MVEIRSKYQRKTLQEVVYNMEERECPHCGHWYMIDYDFLKIVIHDDDDYYRFVCPYCGKISYLKT